MVTPIMPCSEVQMKSAGEKVTLSRVIPKLMFVLNFPHPYQVQQNRCCSPKKNA